MNIIEINQEPGTSEPKRFMLQFYTNNLMDPPVWAVCPDIPIEGKTIGIRHPNGYIGRYVMERVYQVPTQETTKNIEVYVVRLTPE